MVINHDVNEEEKWAYVCYFVVFYVVDRRTCVALCVNCGKIYLLMDCRIDKVSNYDVLSKVYGD